MVNKDILGGLKVALSRGDSLQSAMQSFYNAGYTKEEIEEAARALTLEISQQQYYQRQNLQQPVQQGIPKRPILNPKPAQLIQNSQSQRIQPSQIPQQPPQIQQPKPTPIQQLGQQKPKEPQTQVQQVKYVPPQLQQNQEEIQATKQIVSNYSQESSKYTIDFITIMLITILLILLGILAAVFFFKDQVVAFLNKFLQ